MTSPDGGQRQGLIKEFVLTHRNVQILGALFLSFLATFPALADKTPRRIALTFDDAPRAADGLLAATERSQLLVRSLERANVTGAMFFVTTKNLSAAADEGDARLRRYVDAGHVLGNHSHAHRSANRTNPEEFVADARQAQRRLAGTPGMTPYFRYPYLHEGRTAEQRDAIRTGLAAAGLKNGYVTIDKYDWYLQKLFSEAVASGRPLNLDGWRELYVDTLLSAVNVYDEIAMRTLKRSPRHILLLHENELAALFVDDLVAALRAEGWEIIPAVDAFEDAIANTEPDTLFLGQGRVAALAAANGAPVRTLRDPLEAEDVLRSKAVQQGLVALARGAYLDQEPPGIVPQKFAPERVSIPGRFEYGTAFSADGREFYFSADNKGQDEIHAMHFDDGRWAPSQVLLAHPDYNFANPFLSRDGTRLYFITTQPDAGEEATGTFDIAFVRRRRGGWTSVPERLSTSVNSPDIEYFVSIADDGTLAFASDMRAAPEAVTNFDIYLAKPTAGGYGTPTVLPSQATTQAYEGDPFLAADGSYVVFSATRHSGAGERDLFVSFRGDNNNWSEAISLGPRINTPGIEFCPFVTRDGRFLFYSSNEDIYWVDAAVIEIARQKLATR